MVISPAENLDSVEIYSTPWEATLAMVSTEAALDAAYSSIIKLRGLFIRETNTLLVEGKMVV